MKFSLAILALCLAPAAYANKWDSLPVRVPQTTPASTVPAPPPVATFDPTSLVATLGANTQFTNWVHDSLINVGVNQAADEARLTVDETQLNALNQSNGSTSSLISGLQGQINVMQAQIATLQSQVATLQQNPPPSPFIYALAFSTSNTRLPASNLNGATISGSIYVFSAAAANLQGLLPNGVASVSYWLDNPAMTGVALHVESAAPWDFAGSTGTATVPPANAWVSTTVANGTHSITQKIVMTSGGVETDTASFTVSN